MTRDKYLCRYYCSTLKRGRIVEHLKVVHHKEVDVAAAMAMGPVDQSKAFELIRNQGNFEHNVKVLQGDALRESFIQVRRQEKYVNPPDYIPCPSCYGFFYHPELWRHVKHYCKQVNREDGSETRRRVSITARSRLIVLDATVEVKLLSDEKKLLNSALTSVQRGDVKDTIMKDKDILLFGGTLLSKLGIRRKNDVIQRMRQVGQTMSIYMY